MVAIPRQCPFGDDKAVQVNWAVFFFFGKETQPELSYDKHPLINQDIRYSLCLFFFGLNFLKIAILLYVLCTHNRKTCLEVLTFEMAIKIEHAKMRHVRRPVNIMKIDNH